MITHEFLQNVIIKSAPFWPNTFRYNTKMSLYWTCYKWTYYLSYNYNYVLLLVFEVLYAYSTAVQESTYYMLQCLGVWPNIL